MGRQGRPPTKPGTWGTIRCHQIGPKKWRARVYYREVTGGFRRPSATAATKKGAEAALKDRIATWVVVDTGAEIFPHTPIRVVAALWLAEIDEAAQDADLSDGTAARYHSTWRNHVDPEVGDLRCEELTVLACRKAVRKAKNTHSMETANGTRTVLTGICDFAVRYGAMTDNPVRKLDRLRRGKAARRKPPKTLDVKQRRDLLAKVEADVAQRAARATNPQQIARVQVWLDLPKIIQCLLSLGGRLGEVLACDHDDVWVDDEGWTVVRLGHHLVPQRGGGLRRVKGRKANQRELVLRVPRWAAPIWLALKAAAVARDGGPLFVNTKGGWLDLSNTTKRIRAVCDAAGYPEVTSHICRAIVTTDLDRAGLPASETADQTGNTVEVINTHYRSPRVTNTRAAIVLEGIWGDQEDDEDAADAC